MKKILYLALALSLSMTACNDKEAEARKIAQEQARRLEAERQEQIKLDKEINDRLDRYRYKIVVRYDIRNPMIIGIYGKEEPSEYYDVKFSVNNNSDKDIKYVRIYYAVVNRVGDAQECEYPNNTKLLGAELVGPLPQGENKSCVLEQQFKCKMADSIKPEEIEIVFMDNSTLLYKTDPLTNEVPLDGGRYNGWE